ncbi:hypothetical protein KAI87_00015 [Myxococcota bacterium]|nr:hypothetical protein [Myxococcota bacterium]
MSKIKNHPRLRPLVAAVVVFVASILPLSSALNSLHFVFVDHVYCAEHGQMAHVKAHDEGQNVEQRPETRRDSYTQTANATAFAHDSCHLTIASRKWWVTKYTPAPLFNFTSGFMLLPHGTSIAKVSQATRTLAPKQSPPFSLV